MASTRCTTEERRATDAEEMKAKQASLVERRMRFMPCTVDPHDSVAHARALLDERRINHLPIVSNGRLIGIVSRLDLKISKFSATRPAIREALELHPDRVPADAVMTTEVYTATRSNTLTYATRLMLRKHVNALPIVEEGRLMAILSRNDTVDAFPRFDGSAKKPEALRYKQLNIPTENANTFRAPSKRERRSQATRVRPFPMYMDSPPFRFCCTRRRARRRRVRQDTPRAAG
jgi:CBS domain-containing protein